MVVYGRRLTWVVDEVLAIDMFERYRVYKFEFGTKKFYVQVSAEIYRNEQDILRQARYYIDELMIREEL